MITACHDTNQTPKKNDSVELKQPSNDCFNNESANDSHFDKIPALGCPVK